MLKDFLDYLNPTVYIYKGDLKWVEERRAAAAMGEAHYHRTVGGFIGRHLPPALCWILISIAVIGICLWCQVISSALQPKPEPPTSVKENSAIEPPRRIEQAL